MRVGAILFLQLGTPLATAQAAAGVLRAGTILLLHPDTPVATVQATANALRAGVRLCPQQGALAVAVAAQALLALGIFSGSEEGQKRFNEEDSSLAKRSKP